MQEDQITIKITAENLEKVQQIPLPANDMVKVRIALLKLDKAKLQAELDKINAELAELRK